MSLTAIRWARAQRCGSGIAKAVLRHLCDVANEAADNIWPSIPTIARETEFTEAAVKRALRHLEQGGWITIEAQHRANGALTSNRYHLNMNQTNNVYHLNV